MSIAAKKQDILNYGCLVHIKPCSTDDLYNPISSSVSKWLDTFLQTLTFDPLYVKYIEVIFIMRLGICLKCFQNCQYSLLCFHPKKKKKKQPFDL